MEATSGNEVHSLEELKKQREQSLLKLCLFCNSDLTKLPDAEKRGRPSLICSKPDCKRRYHQAYMFDYRRRPEE